MWLEPAPANSSGPFSMMRCYRDNMVATCTMMHWWLLLFLNRMIVRLEPSSQLQEDNASMAEDICRSHEFAMQQKPFGSMFTTVSTSLRIASADVKDLATRDWISKLLATMDYRLRLRDYGEDEDYTTLSIVRGLIEPFESC